MSFASVPLSEIAEINPLHEEAIDPEEEVSFLGMADVSELGTTTLGEIRPYGEVRTGYTPFRAGDVLVAKITPCFQNGKIAQARLEREIGAGSTEFHVIRAGKEADARYLLRFLRQDWIRVEGELRMTGSGGQRRVPEAYLRNLMIPLPSIEEQKRIAAVLDQVDALRAKRREAIALLDNLAQSIFLDMFGDPLRNPQNWGTEKIGSLLSIKPSYGTMIPAADETVGSLCIRVANIQNWSLDLSSRKYVNLPPSDIDRHGVVAGDLLMARAIATQEHLGKAIVADPEDEKWAFDSHIMRLRFNPQKADPRFVQALLGSPGGRSIFLKATRRSTVQYNINSKEISELEIPLPPIGKQKSFRSALERVDKAREINRRHLAALGELFTSLQHRAFSGTLWDYEAPGEAA
ncbi:restriction endonuclease subunit S [Streptomyces anandii]|uniref:restriction endonuclease subunit S n=1 Tax=Streptomyces anandii TaxID=285454 RepID=UPI00379AE3FF